MKVSFAEQQQLPSSPPRVESYALMVQKSEKISPNPILDKTPTKTWKFQVAVHFHQLETPKTGKSSCKKKWYEFLGFCRKFSLNYASNGHQQHRRDLQTSMAHGCGLRTYLDASSQLTKSLPVTGRILGS